MKIRLMGTKEEIAVYIARLPDDLIIERSAFYPNRGCSKQGRVYLDVRTEDITYKRLKG